MKYTPTRGPLCLIVNIQLHRDDRGFFSNSLSVPVSSKVRGSTALWRKPILFTAPSGGPCADAFLVERPDAEAKLVRCTRGAIMDVAVDARPESATYGRHVMVSLTADNHCALFLPPYVSRSAFKHCSTTQRSSTRSAGPRPDQ